MMATQFSHNSFLYSKYIIRKGNETFVSSVYLKLQSFFILIPGSPKLPGPPKTFSFILYTYHSQNQKGEKDCQTFSPFDFVFYLVFYFVLFSVFLPSVVFFLPHKAPKNAVDITKSEHQTNVFRSSPIAGSRILHRPSGPRYSHAAPSGENGLYQARILPIRSTG